MTEPTFKRPELEDKEIISSYFEKAQSRSCERTFVNVYLWSRHYKVQYAIIEDTLVFRDSGKNLSFTYPAGEPENVKKALEFLMEYCKEKDVPFILYNVTPHMFAQLDKWYPKKFFIEYNRDLADYVYETEKLASLAGKKLHGKRNHISLYKRKEFSVTHISAFFSGSSSHPFLFLHFRAIWKQSSTLSSFNGS